MPINKFNIETPIGELEIMTKSGAIILCEFSDRQKRITAHLAKHYNGDEIVNISAPAPIKTAFDMYFKGELHALEKLPIAPLGSAHQLKAWKYLQTIPAGTTQSYGTMAKNIDSHARAVGSANGRNAIALTVPCHRIIGADGSLTGYAGGIERKKWLLKHEGAI